MSHFYYYDFSSYLFVAWWYVVNQVCLSFLIVCLMCVDLECHVVNHYDCLFFLLFHGAVSLIFGTSFIVEIAFISF